MEVLTFWAVLAALVIFVAYNTISVGVFGIPHSLSMTYYLWKEEAGRGWYFSLMMFVVVALLMPAWITLSEGSDFQFLAFLAPASLLFVAEAPAFMGSRLERRVHSVSAILAAVFSIAWIVLVTPYWMSVPVFACGYAIAAILTSSYKTSIVYWLETVAFSATFASVIAYAVS